MLVCQKVVGLVIALALAVGLGTGTSDASATEFPVRPIRLVVGQPAGGPTDIGARLFAEKLRAVIGQPVVVENKPGAATQIAIQYVAKAQADGYTLLYGGNSFASLPFTSKSYDVDWTRDITPISVIANLPVGIAVSSTLNIRNLDEFLADIKANPSKRFYASMGPNDFITMQLFKEAGSLDFDTVRYNGATPAFHGMLAGDVHFTYTTLGALKPFQDQGKLRVVALWGNKRSSLMPQVPAITEHAAFRNVPFTPSWHGVAGPGKMPSAVVRTLSDAIAKIGRDPDFVKRMADVSMEVVAGTPGEMTKRLQEDIVSWQRIVKQIDLKPQ